MTADPGTELARPEDMEYTGLEDFDTTKDAVMPRLSIVHKEAVFKDNLSGEKFNTIKVVLLGLVKQRILWDTEVDDDAKPMCKSVNFTEGNPDPKTFPWQASGFDPASYPAPEGDGQIALPCTACALKEWGTNPQGGKTPWCAEQHTFPLLMDINGDGSVWTPALFTVQKTGIKPSKTYLTSFARTKTPTYTVVTQLSLTAQKRGQTDYAVPSFAKVGNTEQSDWPMYAQQYRSIREFITVPRQMDKSDTTAPTTAAAPAPAAAASPATSSAASVAAPTAPPSSETVTPSAQPAEAPAQAAAPVAEAPATTPTQPVAETPAAAPATAPPLTADDDDLPF